MANDLHPTRIGYRPSTVAGCAPPKIATKETPSEEVEAWLAQHEARIQALAAKVEADERRHQESLDAIQRAADPQWDLKRRAETNRRQAQRLAQRGQ